MGIDRLEDAPISSKMKWSCRKNEERRYFEVVCTAKKKSSEKAAVAWKDNGIVLVASCWLWFCTSLERKKSKMKKEKGGYNRYAICCSKVQ